MASLPLLRARINPDCSCFSRSIRPLIAAWERSSIFESYRWKPIDVALEGLHSKSASKYSSTKDDIALPSSRLVWHDDTAKRNSKMTAGKHKDAAAQTA